MIFVSLLVLINLALLVVAILSVTRKNMDRHQRDMINHFGVLELAWAIFSILIGLFVLFDVLESKDESSSFFKLAGGLSLVTLIVSYGFGILHFFFSIVLLLKLQRTRIAGIE